MKGGLLPPTRKIIYVAVSFNGNCTIDAATITHTTGSGDEGLIAKFSPVGNLMWINKWGSNRQTNVSDIQINENNELVCTAIYQLNASIGSTSLTRTEVSGDGILIANYNTEGVLNWVKNYNTTTVASGYNLRLATDNSNNIFLSGQFHSSLTLGDVPASSASTIGDFFVAKFNNEAIPLWIKSNEGTGITSGWDIVNDLDGNCYVTGTFKDQLKVETREATSTGNTDMFILKFKTDGFLDNFLTMGGTGNDTPRAITRGVNNQILVTGSFFNTISFSTSRETYTAMHITEECFIANFKTDLSLTWFTHTTDRSRNFGNGIAANIKRIGVAGHVDGPEVRFGGFTIVTSPHSSFLAITGY